MSLASAGAASAAELGDVSVRSFIGQPLAADIELVALAPDEVNALQVRLAQADVFRGANITMNPALASVHMAVVKRDQKQFLHVTTTRAIDAEYVHLYLELSAAGRHDVRLATVWLQADPNPAPVAATSADAAQLAAQARAERAASTPAVPVTPAPRDRTRPAPLPSAHESEVGVPGAVRAAASATPTRPTSTVAVRDLASRIADAMGTPRPATPASVPASAKPVAKREAAEAAVPLPVAQALLPLAPLPLPAGVKRPAAPAACTPSGISAKECKALDNHSVALSSKLVELEGKMKALQGAIKATAGAPAAPVAAPAAAPKVGQAGTAVLAAAGSSVAAAVAAPAASAHETPKSASVASAAPGPASVAEKVAGKSAEGKSEQSGKVAAGDGASASASAAVGSASATASADGHGANAAASAAGASASATAPVPLKRVLPKLKYKKEKPVERPPNYAAWGAGAVGVLMLAGAGLLYLRRKKSGAAPLKIWQGFRRKKSVEAGLEPQPAQPLHEVTPESIMQ